MYLARKFAYNKKGNIQFWYVECLPVILVVTFNSFELSVYFFITKTNKVKSSKMSDM